MLAACVNSASSVKSGFPPLPSSVRTGGEVTPWPKGDLKVKDTPELLAKVRKNEVKQARIVRNAKAHIKRLEKLNGGK